MDSKNILAAAAVAAISAVPVSAATQDIGSTNAVQEAGTSTQGLPTDNILNDTRPAVRALLNAKLNGLVASESNPSGEFQVVDYLVGWNSYGLIVKERRLQQASFENGDLKSLMGNRDLNQKIASGRATFRDLIETVNEMGLDQHPGSVRMGKDGLAIV